MRPPLSSRSSTKPRGSKIRACSHSDLGEFLFWWHNCHWGEKIEKSLSDISNFLRWNSLRFGREVIGRYSLLAFLAFNLSEKFVRQGFRLAKKHKKCLKRNNYLDNPYFFRFEKFLLARLYLVWAYQKILPKEIEEIWNQSQIDVKKWRCLSSFNLRLKALISEVTVEQ